MLPLVCSDAIAILFLFDLSRKSTLNSIREWYRQARGFNKVYLIVYICLFGFLLTDGDSVDGDTVFDWHKV